MTITRKSLDKSKLDPAELNHLRAMKDKDIDYSDIPELDASFFSKTKVRFPVNKKSS